ncbi:MAG: ATP-binding cassette domain-containing protein [Micrococcales bacterium]|nr:ATP-binding cassette domain-containing protein [Micrococcales bacterium]
MTSSVADALVVEGVTKAYSGRIAVDQVSFGVPRGVLTGFVGGNGAGKTTTMRIIMGVLAQDAGRVFLDGEPVTRAVSSRFGYMPEERGLYPKDSAASQVAYLAQLHGVDKAQAEGRAISLLDRLGLKKRAYDPVETLSLGNQQRAQIAAALVHDPDVLILDEPFSGLDPLAVENVTALLAEYTARGAAILFSSHQLDLVERITEDVVIIAEGQIRAAGRRDDILATRAGSRFRLAAPGDLTWVPSAPGVAPTAVEPGVIEFSANDDAAQQVLRLALDRGHVTSFGPAVPTLAEVFKDIVRDSAEEEDAR